MGLVGIPVMLGGRRRGGEEFSLSTMWGLWGGERAEERSFVVRVVEDEVGDVREEKEEGFVVVTALGRRGGVERGGGILDLCVCISQGTAFMDKRRWIEGRNDEWMDQ